MVSGIFKPTGNQIWSSVLDIANVWQPIGVSTVEPSRAYLIGDTATCPAAAKIEETKNDLPATKKFLADNADFINRFSKYSGYNATENWEIIAGLQDTLLCESDYFGDQFQWPKWIDQVGPDCWQKMKEFRDFGFSIYGEYGLQYLRMRAGTFLKEMLSNLKANIDKGDINKENRELYTYGTHDTVSYI